MRNHGLGGGRLAAAAVLAVSLGPASASAHDLWLERDGEGLVLRHGHRGGELLAIERARLRAARCVDGGTTRDLLAGALLAGKEVRLPGRCAAASAFIDGGFWSLTPDGEVNRPRTEVPDAVKAWASRQFAKWVDPGSPGASAPVGDELEIVPVSDLGRARAGEKITVRVLLSGGPAPGAIVAVDHRALAETDGEGEARIKVRAAEVEVVTATLRRKVATAEADEVVLEASLAFEVAR